MMNVAQNILLILLLLFRYHQKKLKFMKITDLSDFHRGQGVGNHIENSQNVRRINNYCLDLIYHYYYYIHD